MQWRQPSANAPPAVASWPPPTPYLLFSAPPYLPDGSIAASPGLCRVPASPGALCQATWKTDPLATLKTDPLCQGGGIGRRVDVQWDDIHVRLLDPGTGQLLREHLRTRRGWHRIADDDRPARTPPKTASPARAPGRPRLATVKGGPRPQRCSKGPATDLAGSIGWQCGRRRNKCLTIRHLEPGDEQPARG